MVVVTVIIPAYNSAQQLPEALDSVFKQTYRDFEIIVVDDGSTDGTRELLEGYKNRITYLYQENAGPSKARNTGIRAAKGRYLAFLDADDHWLPPKLELQIKLIESDPRLGLVFSDAEYFGGGESMVGSYWKQRGCYDQMISESGLIRNAFSTLMRINPIMPSTALLKRDCFEKAGGFDEGLRYVEDKDMWLRMSVHCFMACVPFPLVKRRVHGYSPKQVVSVQESIIYVVRKIEHAYPEEIARENVDTKKILGPLYYTLGRIYFGSDEFARARQTFWSSLRNRFSWEALRFLAVASMGARVIHLLRYLKRSLKSRTPVY
ncbi:MAG: glycosyltransferase [Gammaproteobacteria bacterium]